MIPLKYAFMTASLCGATGVSAKDGVTGVAAGAAKFRGSIGSPKITFQGGVKTRLVGVAAGTAKYGTPVFVTEDAPAYCSWVSSRRWPVFGSTCSILTTAPVASSIETTYSVI